MMVRLGIHGGWTWAKPIGLLLIKLSLNLIKVQQSIIISYYSKIITARPIPNYK